MPVIFRKQDGRWVPEQAPGSPERFFLAAALLGGPASAGPGPAGSGSVVARAARDAGDGRDREWVMLVHDADRVLHNGQRVTAGLRVLAHRDSLAFEGHESVFFSTEEAARVEPFAGAAKLTCPRCRGAIEPGEYAVKCPGCGVVHHQTDERNCWTYSPTCALCSQPSALDTGLQWTPEAL
jgi:hypothetical protein